MRAKKINGVYYQIRFFNGEFHIDWATERGRRKGHFYISNGINITGDDWEKYAIAENLKEIYWKYDKIEMRAVKLFKRLESFEWNDITKKINTKKSNLIKDFLETNKINWKI